MGFYPFNPKMGQEIQTSAYDKKGVVADRGFIAHYQIAAADAIAADDDYIKTAVTLADGATTTVLKAALTHQPPTPRLLSVTGNAATVAGNVVITGKDFNGDVITDTIVANANNTVGGTKAFAEVTQIVFPARGAVADTITVGVSDLFGIPFLLPHNTILLVLNNKAVTSLAVAGTSSFSATALASNYLDLTDALAAQQIDVYMIV